MALKALLLKKRMDERKKALDALTALDADFATRAAALEQSISEVTEETSEEDRSALEEMVSSFDAEKTEHEDKKKSLEREIGDLETELAAEEAAQNTDPAPAPAAPEAEERKEKKHMEYRSIKRMTAQERTEFVAREDVKAYLSEVRSCISEKRALTNVGLTIPEVMLGMLRQSIGEYSKLYKHVNVKPLSGDGRLVVMGTVPEAIWTDCCANLNELDLVFNDVEVGCWKVGGFFAVCNASLEDSDIDLAAELISALGQAIGLALDKAILYGTGTRMPLGIVTRLAQESQPGSYPATARPWADLHTSNLVYLTAGQTGATFFAALAEACGKAKGKYSTGAKFWAMNETTHTKIVANAVSINAAGAIVSGVEMTMPVIGGAIEVLDFIPDNVIIGGYGDLYLLAERAGSKFATSDHVRFLQDQTVFKGTARYDGQPAIAEGFVGIGIAGVAPTASMTFPQDAANTVAGILLPSAASVVESGTLQLSAVLQPNGVDGTVTWASATTGKATVSSSGLVTGVATGSSVISATCNGFTAQCTVTVTSAS